MVIVNLVYGNYSISRLYLLLVNGVENQLITGSGPPSRNRHSDCFMDVHGFILQRLIIGHKMGYILTMFEQPHV